MTDRYAGFVTSGPGRALVKRLSLPNPPRLRRHHDGARLLAGPVLLGGDGRLTGPVAALLADLDADIRTPTADGPVTGAYGALVFDATGIADPAQLGALYAFFHPYARAVAPCGRVIVLGTPPQHGATAAEAVAQRALEGFVRSVGKEFGQGITAQLVYVAPGAERRIESTMRFLLSGRSAYVSGQTVTVGVAGATGAIDAVDAPRSAKSSRRLGGSASGATVDWDRPLAGRIALVTGAARGIGAAIAEVLTRDGATVICLDVPANDDALPTVANAVGGVAYELDLTATDAPGRLADFIEARYDHVDIVVHNAGITRDKTLANMRQEQWDPVLDVNLLAPLRVNEALLERDLIRAGGRIIAVSSIAGIAGNRGQTNYATSTAGVIGVVDAQTPRLAEHGITINAVAPGFIETAMTAKMPMFLREAGRRLNSMAQGGLPVDVAETIAWLAAPGSMFVTGNVIRVCGQSLLGA